MLDRIRTLLCGMIALIPLVTPGNASAKEVRYEFSGEVDSVRSADELPPDINGNSTFTGSFTYDDSIPGTPLPNGGKQYQANQTGHIEFLIDEKYLFRMDLVDTDRDARSLYVHDGTGSTDGASDQFLFTYSNYSQPSPTDPNLFTRSVTINLVDSYNKDAITSDELQGLTLDLSSFTWARMEITGNNDGSLRQDFRISGAFTSLTLVSNTAPIADAGPDQSVNCDGPDGTLVTLDATGSSDPDGDPLTYAWSVPAGTVLDDPTNPKPLGLFPIGVTTVTLTVTDGNGGVDVDDVVITVVDETPPEVACTTSDAALWPPDHTMRPVTVSIHATDHCTAPENLLLLSVTLECNEPDDADGLGDGDTTGDTNGADGYADAVDVTDSLIFNPETASFEGVVYLRAERDGNGSGRTYSINASVRDSSNNRAETSCVVIVPHDHRNK